MKKLVFMVLVVSVQAMYAPDYSEDEQEDVARALAVCYQTLTGMAGENQRVRGVDALQKRREILERSDLKTNGAVFTHEGDREVEMKKEDWKMWGRALVLETRVVFREMFGV